MASPAALPDTSSARRLAAEWELVGELARRNPDRLHGLSADDRTLCLTLSGTPAPLPGGGLLGTHRLRLHYPRFFPALPLELYLETPVFHPNIHPVTGFVCLWDRHGVSNTAEHALHKTASMLGWKLMTVEAEHVMQPEAAALANTGRREELVRQCHAESLLGVQAATLPAEAPAGLRRRLS